MLTISYYAEGATNYKILYAPSSGVIESTPLVSSLTPTGNGTSFTIPFSSNNIFYINVRALNAAGQSALGNEISQVVYQCCGPCRKYRHLDNVSKSKL